MVATSMECSKGIDQAPVKKWHLTMIKQHPDCGFLVLATSRQALHSFSAQLLVTASGHLEAKDSLQVAVQICPRDRFKWLPGIQ